MRMDIYKRCKECLAQAEHTHQGMCDNCLSIHLEEVRRTWLNPESRVEVHTLGMARRDIEFLLNLLEGQVRQPSERKKGA